jgi:hypothetical protein
MGGTPQYFITWSSGQAAQTASGLAAGTYTASVADANGCEAQTQITIQYECTQPDLLTQLIDEDCDATDYNLGDIIHCNEVAGAEMYNWIFATAVGDVLGDELSVGPAFLISQIPGIESGMSVLIQVRVMFEGEWGPVGPVCSVSVAGENGIPYINDQHCGGEIDTWGTMLSCNTVTGALNYEWNISGPSYEFTTYSATNNLNIAESLQLIAGNTYQVKVRCGMGGGVVTEWSDSCPVTIAVNIGIFGQVSEITDIHFYPNPCDGENISIDFGNLTNMNSVKDLVIFSSTGQLATRLVATGNGTADKSEYQFENALSPGIYIIRYTLGEIPFEKKMIVR